jgi:hypothetical protein
MGLALPCSICLVLLLRKRIWCSRSNKEHDSLDALDPIFGLLRMKGFRAVRAGNEWGQNTRKPQSSLAQQQQAAFE